MSKLTKKYYRRLWVSMLHHTHSHATDEMVQERYSMAMEHAYRVSHS